MTRVAAGALIHLRTAALLGTLLGFLPACRGGQDDPPIVASTKVVEPRWPDVVAARATRAADGSWRFDVTLSSPYDTPERYADAWRILGPDDEQLGIRILTHDHAHEQPFTRSLEGVRLASGLEAVVVQGRDAVSGWGGRTVTVTLER